MGLKDLTQDLSNFKWTSYEKAGEGKSPQPDRTDYFQRPSNTSLLKMSSKFGQIDTKPGSRGPYGVSNVMDGEKQGRGFIPPGSTPEGFTKDMDERVVKDVSKLILNSDIVRTPLSHEISGVNSTLDYGVVGSKTINLQPAAEGAYGNYTIPISSYTSRLPIEGIPYSKVGGYNTFYGNLNTIAGRKSKYEADDGTYTPPVEGQITSPGTSTNFPPFEGTQTTFVVADSYPRNTSAYSIDSQFGWTHQSKYLESHGAPWRGFKLRETLNTQYNESGGGESTFPDFYPPLPEQAPPIQHPSKHYYSNSEPVYNATSYLELQYLKSYGNTDGIWPYQVLSYLNPNSTGPNATNDDHPLITRGVGQRYSVGGPIENWMALQVARTREDDTRISKWLETPKGNLWITKQNILQELNPRPETRGFSVGNIKLSLPPFMHIARHTGGSTYMDEADFGPLYDGDSPTPAFDPNSIGGLGDLASSKLSELNQQAMGKSPRYRKLVGAFNDTKSFLGDMMAGLDNLNSALGAVDFNEVGKGGRLRFLLEKMVDGSEKGSVVSMGKLGSINLTDMRNSAAPFGRPPKLPTQTVFSQRGPFGEQGLASMQSLKSPIKRYKSTLYGGIGKHLFPELSPTSEQTSQTELGQTLQEETEGIMESTDELTGMTFKNYSIAQVQNNQLYWKEQIEIDEQKTLAKNYHEKNKEAIKKLGGIGDPGRLSNAFTKKVDDKKEGAGLGEIKLDKTDPQGYKSMAVDRVNATPYGHELPNNVSDYVKFKFKDYVNNKPIIFRAILSGISDSISPEWTPTRYIGRPDNVYVYTGVERKVSFSFEIYPKTKQEFPILLEKLNYLVGLCYPAYADNHRMVAPFISLTIGDMFNDSPGFLDSLSVEVDDTGTWEMDEGLQFPKHITCGCSFTYIGKHQPSMLGKHYELDWLTDKGYGENSDGTKNRGTFTVGKGGDITNTIDPNRGKGKLPLFEQFGSEDTKPTPSPTDPFWKIFGSPAQSQGSG